MSVFSGVDLCTFLLPFLSFAWGIRKKTEQSEDETKRKCHQKKASNVVEEGLGKIRIVICCGSKAAK